MRPVAIDSTSSLVAVFLLCGPAFAGGPKVGGNFLVDLDHGQPFPKNKQHEPAITRDPLTRTLLAGANHQLGEPPCRATTAPLPSPCTFLAGAPLSLFYPSPDNG